MAQDRDGDGNQGDDRKEGHERKDGGNIQAAIIPKGGEGPEKDGINVAKPGMLR